MTESSTISPLCLLVFGILYLIIPSDRYSLVQVCANTRSYTQERFFFLLFNFEREERA